MSRLDRCASAAVRHAVSRRTALRGEAHSDGRITLVTVDFHSTRDVLRLIESFRRFVDHDADVVVVQNGDRRAASTIEAAGARCVGLGLNLGHGLGLDYGLRFVRSEYTLVCDPDSAIVAPTFHEELLARIAAAGAVSIDNGAAFYHPVCLGFRSELWKQNRISFEQRWPHWDVAGELTAHLGGLRDDALLPRTRAAGPPLASARPGHAHHYGEVYADAFTNTYCMSRKAAEPENHDFDGWARAELNAYHLRWQGWVDDLLAGRATIDDFPT